MAGCWRVGNHLAREAMLALRDELRAYGLGHLMEPTGGTRGSIDDAILGLGLDPTATVARDELTEPDRPDDDDDRLDGGEPPTNRLVIRVLPIGIVTVIGAAIIGVLAFGHVTGPAGGQATVPNLVGLSLDRARDAAGQAGFELAASTVVRTDTQPEGTVVDQDPPAGTVADTGSDIVPFVSTERQLVLVPDVIGEPEAQAIADLSSAGLTVRRGEPVDDPSIQAGTIVETSPAAGTRVATGTSITYVSSTGRAIEPDETEDPGAGSSDPLPSPSTSGAPTSVPTPEATPSNDGSGASPGPTEPSATP
jgi:hypothetical protein